MEDAVRDPSFLAAIQGDVWRSVGQEKPELTETRLLDLLEKRTTRTRRYKAAAMRLDDEDAWTALSIWMDKSAGRASGEGVDLLETDEGKRILARGRTLLSIHLARELLR